MKVIANVVNWVKKLFVNPKVRLAVRTAAAAGGAFYLHIKNVDPVDAQVVQTAIVAAIWAGFEILTPVNSLVGLFKQ